MKVKSITINNLTYYTLIDEIENSDLLSFINIKKDNVIYPQICLLKQEYEEIYDYDYDDNLSFCNVETTDIYYPIFYNPFNGDKFSFDIVEKIDLSNEYNKLLKEKQKIEKMRTSRKKYELSYQINEQIEILVNSPIIFEKSNSYSSFDKLHILDLL